MLDNTEDILNSEADSFKKEIGKILETCKNVKILITSWESLEKVNEIKECLIDLDLLTPEQTIKMIRSFITWDIKEDEIWELL